MTYRLGALVIGMMLSACGSPEPVATGYKKELSKPSAPFSATQEQAPAATANLANGQAIYNKTCAAAGCHGPLATSTKANKAAATIEAAATLDFHKSAAANWPKGQNAIDLAEALKKTK